MKANFFCSLPSSRRRSPLGPTSAATLGAALSLAIVAIAPARAQQEAPPLPVAPAPAQPAPAIADAAGGAVLAEGTPIIVALVNDLKSNGVKSDDPILFRVVQPVASADPTKTVFLPKGAVAMGRVIVAKRRATVGKGGDLQFTCDYAVDVNRRRVYLRSGKLGSKGRKNTAGSVATTLLVGSVGLLINGRDTGYPAGTEFTVYVDQDARWRPQTPDDKNAKTE